MSKPEAPHKLKDIKTTGHEWDGIQEYNNPLPRWWVWVFLVCVVFSAGYVVMFPMWPGIQGVLGWSSLGLLKEDLAVSTAGQKAFEERLAATDVLAVKDDGELHTYTMAAGKALFAMHCSQCHGSGGAGVKGYPNLQDDVWIHGGSLSEIAFTITHGIRNTTDAEARNPGQMLAFGKDELLTAEEIKDVANYLSVLAYNYAPNESTKRGEQVFINNCTSCHGDNGQGMRDMGAPPLNTGIWTFAPTMEDRVRVIHDGIAGVMPAWGQKLSQSDIKKLAVYVHGLGGGEAEVVEAPVVVEVSATVDASGTLVQ